MPNVTSADNILALRDATPKYIPPGATLNQCWDILNGDDEIRPMVRAFHRGVIQDDWSTITLEGEVVVFAMLPAGGGDGGGKQVLSMVAMVAIMVLAVYAGPIAAQAMGFAAEGFAASTITAGIGIVGSLAVGALFKPPVAGLNGPTESNLDDVANPSPNIVSQSNQAKPFQVIPVLFGSHEIYPDLAAQPYVEKNGCKQTLHAIYCCGFGLTSAPINLKLGGIPWEELLKENPEMAWNHVNLTGAYHSPKALGYEGIRDVNAVNIELKDKDGTGATDNTEVVIPKSGADKVYLDVIFPGGIFDISDQGDTLEYTVSLKVEKFSGGAWSDIGTSDLLNESDICVDADNEEIARGELKLVDTYTYDWAIMDKIIDDGYEGGNSVDFVKNNNVICGEGSHKDGAQAGWNRGLAAVPTFPATCGITNGRNAIPWIRRTEDVDTGWVTLAPSWMRVRNVANNGAVYFTFTPGSYSAINDGGKFAEGFYEFMLTVSNPSVYVDAVTDPTPVSDARGRLVLNKLNAAGTQVGDPWERSNLGIVKQSGGTSFSLGVDVGPGQGFPGKIEVMFQFDLIDGRTATSRKSCIKVDSLLCRFTPRSASAANGAELRIKVPIRGGPINNSSTPPRVGDSISLGVLVEKNCPTYCVPLGHTYNLGIDYDTDLNTWVPKVASYVQRQGELLRVTAVTNTGNTDISTNQHFAIYKVTLDSPLYYQSNAVVVSRLLGPGFHIKSRFRGAIHFGLMLKYYSKYRISKNNLPEKLSVEKAILASISSIDSNASPIVAPPGVVYSIVEISVPAHGQMGTTLKPLSLEVARGIRKYDELSYHDDKLHQADDQKSGTEYSGDCAWTYLNVLLGLPGGRPALRNDLVKGGILNDYIDLESFRKWSEMCDDEGFDVNYIVNGYSTVGDLLRLIASTGRGRPTYRDGKHSIIFDGDPRYFTGSGDKAKPIVRQMFTPENTFNGSSSMTYLADVHAVKVQYTDKIKRQQVEFIQYLPGFALTGSDYYDGGAKDWKAEKFETMSLPGVGTYEQAGDLAAYYIKEVILRRERVIRTLDVENLISYEGDIVAVADDVMRLGGRPARVKTVSGATGTVTIQLDRIIPNVVSLGVRIRYFHVTTKKPLLTDPLDVTLDATRTNLTVTLPTGARCEVGYLVLWGRKDRISKDYQISNIKYNADMTATIEALEYYPDPLAYEGNRDPVGESPVIGHVNKPTQVVGSVDWSWAGEAWSAVMQVQWTPVAAAVSYRVRFQGAVRDHLTSGLSVQTRPLISECGQDIGRDVWVYAIDRYGNESDGAKGTIPGKEPDFTIPDVKNFNIDLGRAGVTLVWDLSDSEYVTEYEIRYSPSVSTTGNSWVGAVKKAEVSGNTSTVSIENLRRGTFFIKAKGACSAESAKAAIIISDVIDSDIDTEHSETWTVFDFAKNGILTAVPAGPSGPAVLRLGTAVVGNYTDMRSVTDMPTAYNSDGTVKRRKSGFVMVAAYETGVECFKKAGFVYFNPDWEGVGIGTKIPRNAECFISATRLWDRDSFIFCNNPDKCDGVSGVSQADIVPIYRTWTGSVVPPIDQGWRDIEGGEVKILDHIQLGYRLWSTRACLSAWVPKMTITVRYAKRTEAGHDVDCRTPATVPPRVTCKSDKSVAVRFAQEFFAPPSISILGQDLRAGDSWRVTSETTRGFTVTFYSSSGAVKQTSFDWIAEGYGVK